jgi:hypothetical protein
VDTIGANGYLIKFNRDLDTLWSRDFPDPDGYSPQQTNGIVWAWFKKVKETPDKGFLFVGSYHGAVDYYYPLWVVKTDSMGMVQWEKTYNLPNAKAFHGHSFEILGDSGYVIAGSLSLGIGPGLIRIDTIGNVIWWKSYYMPPHFLSPFYASALTYDSCIIVVVDWVFDKAYSPGPTTPWLFKINAYNGVLQWDRKYQFQENVKIFGVYELSDSGILMYGYNWKIDYNSVIDCKYVGFILRLNEYGDSLWYRWKEYRPGVRDYLWLFGLTLTPDKGFAGVGHFFDAITGIQSTWVMKMDSLGCAVPNCLDTIFGTKVMELFKDVFLVVYPNPVSDQLTIGINEYHESIRELSIYDLNGRCLLRKEIHSPSHIIDVSHFKAGLYILRILTENGKWVEQKFIKE